MKLQIISIICLIYISSIFTYQIFLKPSEKVIASSSQSPKGEAIKVTINKEETKSIIAKGSNITSQSTTLDTYTSGGYKCIGLTHRIYLNEHWNYRVSVNKYNDNDYGVNTSATYNW